MEEKNELNDIILNKGGTASKNKKIILAVATLGIILIIVIMLMNTLASQGTNNLPQAVLPPEPQHQTSQLQDEPLFEEVEVIEEQDTNNENLDQIAKRLKEESLTQQEQPLQNTPQVTQKTNTQQTKVVEKAAKEPKQTTSKVSTNSLHYYVQVGSFSQYKPNKKFLKSITDNSFTYKFHKVTVNSKIINKVIVGPFKNEREARKALKTIKKKIEPGAFIVKI